MASPLRVTGAWTQLLADWLDQENLPAPDIRAALTRHAPDDIIPIPEWVALLERAVALRPGRPAPGLGIGELVRPRHVGVLGYLVLVCRSLGEAMQVYRRYETLFYGRDIAEVVAEAGTVEIRWPADTSLGPLADSVSIAALVSFLRRLVDEPPSPSRVAFVNPPPDDTTWDRYERFFGCPVDFADSHSRVRFPTAFLDIPLPHSDPGLRELLDRQARALLLASPDADAFDRALQQAIVSLLPDAAADLPRVAREMHLSPRTLQRRLGQRGISWQQLLDRTREQLARQYLADASLTLGDIALLLGFSEQSAFTRAFRRWTDSTPARTRRL